MNYFTMLQGQSKNELAQFTATGKENCTMAPPSG
jgi:hypothetical protein